jgi:hypothetical protein
MQSKHSQRQHPEQEIYLLDDNYPKELVEVVGSNHPTRSTFINLVSYRIKSPLILTIVGQMVDTAMVLQGFCPTFRPNHSPY